MWEEKMRRAAEKNGWTFIGITGITNSGKSTVAKRIAERVPAETVNQDVYFRDLDDPNHIWVDLEPTGRYQNWELLICIDWDKMCERVCEIISKRAPTGRAFLILDGHIILNYRPFANLCLEKFFIELDQETVHSRRLQRSDQPDPPGYFHQWTWPMYLRNKREIEDQQINYIDGSQSKDAIFEAVFSKLKPYLSS